MVFFIIVDVSSNNHGSFSMTSLALPPDTEILTLWEPNTLKLVGKKSPNQAQGQGIAMLPAGKGSQHHYRQPIARCGFKRVDLLSSQEAQVDREGESNPVDPLQPRRGNDLQSTR
jgi:hypothetical protein